VVEAYQGGSVRLLGEIMICEPPMEDDVVQKDGRLVVDGVNNIDFSWNEVICGYDALELGSKG
jgi:hypothetical protein